MRQPSIMLHIFVELGHLAHNPKIRISRIVCEKTDYLYFPLHLEKFEKEARFGEMKYLYRHPHTGLKIVGIFATIYNCLRDPFAQLFKYRESGKLSIKQ